MAQHVDDVVGRVDTSGERLVERQEVARRKVREENDLDALGARGVVRVHVLALELDIEVSQTVCVCVRVRSSGAAEQPSIATRGSRT